MMSKFGIECNGHPNEDTLITNIEMVFSFNTKNVQVTEQQFLLMQAYLKSSQSIDCVMGDTDVTCNNIDDVHAFKNNRIIYWVAEHDNNEPVEIRLEHVVDKCYNPEYEMSGRGLQ